MEMTHKNVLLTIYNIVTCVTSVAHIVTKKEIGNGQLCQIVSLSMDLIGKRRSYVFESFDETGSTSGDDRKLILSPKDSPYPN